MKGFGRAVASIAMPALLTLGAGQAHAADAVADFYRGKTVQVLVGFGPGGGYDLYARTLARYMGRHIPGNPTMVPQNMPGAGGVKVMNYLYDVARKDGTVIATFARGLAIEPLLGHVQGMQFDATKFGWVGSVSNEVSICAFWNTSGIRTWQDMQTKPSTIGASAAGADSEIFPTVLRNLFHLPTKVVTGFSNGGADINLGMERGEIGGRCGWSWSSLLSQSKSLLEAKKINIVLQLALQKHEDLPNVPSVMDLADNAAEQGGAEADRLAPEHRAAVCRAARPCPRTPSGLARSIRRNNEGPAIPCRSKTA